MKNNITTMPPRAWKPSPAEARAIRAYCADVEGKRPGQIVICPGERANVNDLSRPFDLNIRRVSDRDDWDDTDLHDILPWSALALGVNLDRKGRALIDFYIYEKVFGDYHGGLLGNAQVYVETIDGAPRVVGFSATCHPYEEADIA